MKFDPPLEQVRFLRRYKRFMVDVERANGEELTVHCPNTGSMKNCLIEGAQALISDSGNPKRKYRHTLEALQVAHGHWAGVNTGRTNALVAEAIAAGRLPELGDPTTLKREVRFGDSRFDLALELDSDTPTYIEVKNVTLGPAPDEPDHGCITFPDSVTERGQKHLRTLMEVIDQGGNAVLMFCVQHGGAKQAGPADEIDPVYGQLLRQARDRGVVILAWRTAMSAEEFVLAEPVPVVM